jgi:hypothetical protein
MFRQRDTVNMQFYMRLGKHKANLPYAELLDTISTTCTSALKVKERPVGSKSP